MARQAKPPPTNGTANGVAHGAASGLATEIEDPAGKISHAVKKVGEVVGEVVHDHDAELRRFSVLDQDGQEPAESRKRDLLLHFARIEFLPQNRLRTAKLVFLIACDIAEAITLPIIVATLFNLIHDCRDHDLADPAEGGDDGESCGDRKGEEIGLMAAHVTITVFGSIAKLWYDYWVPGPTI